MIYYEQAFTYEFNILIMGYGVLGRVLCYNILQKIVPFLIYLTKIIEPII